MKNWIAAMCASLLAASAVAAVPIARCNIGGLRTVPVEIYRDSEIAGSYIYSIQYADHRQLFFESPESSRGLSVKIICAGRKTHALLIYGEFTANYLQGFALTLNAANGKVERLNFAERSPPKWLYLGEKETIVVMPTPGHGDGDKKFITYRQRKGSKAQATAREVDALPVAAGFEIISLERSNQRATHMSRAWPGWQ